MTKFENFYPEDGDLMTVEEFLQCINFGAFTDDDGHGVLATKTQMSDIRITPSTFCSSNLPDWATHVLWFNK